MQADEIAAWLRLLETPGVGGETARRLLAAFGLPEAVLEQSLPALERIVSPAVAQGLRRTPDTALQDLIARTRDWLAEPGHHALSLADSRYPSLLLQTADPPPLLYANGHVELLARQRTLAIVGARNPSAQGARDAHAFASALATAGVTVVSGFARGIDAQAHEGALEAIAEKNHAGSTIAVLGTGCDRVYPAAHRALAYRVAEHGLLLSEFPLGTPPARGNFPRRNRIISGLSRGVLVTEAAVHSGSLITARLAAEQNREVFAIPGSIHNPLARGCHLLLREGAKLVECVDDILAELNWKPATAATKLSESTGKPPPAEGIERPGAQELLDALGYASIGFDELAARTGRSAQWLGEQLLELELQGRVARLPGGRYQRIERA